MSAFEDSVRDAPQRGQCVGCAKDSTHGSSELTASRFAVTFTAELSGGRKRGAGVTNDSSRVVALAARDGMTSLLLDSETASCPDAAFFCVLTLARGFGG
jgi:hypothetical protein